jgi:MFS family permease
MAVDKFGTARVVIFGALMYAAGLLWMATISHPLLFVIGSGVLLGAALACTAFGAVSSIIGRTAPANKRSWALAFLQPPALLVSL